ncbi:hypothetical protein FGK63_02860 [Ruegeria sediminis]|uniref:HEAT repeat domain-containing protein n=1 Tax=Ruegeria sediminis TaxID=2583820 RepID=A0ABY2X4J7_9RHOB|nr:hypothetical protein [Ruegeria sediminis]TMV10018.1 hypothetical protein FGK63_02860 [Ruegeria sediminis]
MTRLSAVLIGFLMGAASAAGACGFHNYVPQPTMVDRLIESEHVVLVRQDPANPFRYKVVEDLSGMDADADIPNLVDSITRRRLARSQDDVVLFAREGAYGPWLRVAYIDSAMQPVLRSVLDQLPEWRLGEDAGRFRTFAELLNHPDPVVGKLALRELDRADYGFLVSHKLQVDTGRILSRIDDRAEMDLRAIRVLLLGIAGGDAARDYLIRGMHRSAQLESTLLGAFATAMIEMDGPESVRTIAETYLSGPAYSAATQEMIVEALALHSQYGDETMQSAVAEAMDHALQAAPHLAPAVARQFGARGVWSQSDTLSSLVRNGSVRSMADVLTVSQYIALAEGVSARSGMGDDVSPESGVFE